MGIGNERVEGMPDVRSVDPSPRISVSAEPPSVTASSVHHASAPSLLRAWFYLIWLSLQRQARVRQMVGIALALLVVAVVFVKVIGDSGRFTMRHWRSPRGSAMTYEAWGDVLSAWPLSPESNALQMGVVGAFRAVLDNSDVMVFSMNVIFGIFISFLLPIWSLSFAVDSLGSEREGGGLIWLLSRPIPRPAIYLAKFLAVLPWSLALNVGGFALICAAAGRAGAVAFGLYWPAVFWSTLAFTALFHLIGAYFQRPAIVAILYAFFLETILGNMPGYMKRVSIGFYTRCMMYEAAQEYGVQPEKPSVYLPVDGATACLVLCIAAGVLLALGMYLFSRKEYQE